MAGQVSSVSPYEEQNNRYALRKFRHAVEKVIQQNQEKGLSRANSPGSRFRSAVEKVFQQKINYKYKPIDHHNEIRILRVHRGKTRDALTCTLFPSSLGSTRSNSRSKFYEYHALSYAGGEGIPTIQLTVYYDLEEREASPHVALSNPGTLYIRANLAAALREIRLENEDINLWVDAVCINQADVVEKKAQVFLMQQIYSGATSIRIWLGDYSLNASLASDFLKSLANLNAQDEFPEMEAKREIWESVHNMVKATYWRRGWRFRDCDLLENVQVMWGSRTLKLEAVERALSAILTRRKKLEPVLHEAGFDNFSAKDFFDRITSRMEVQSDVSTIRATWVEQTLKEPFPPAAVFQSGDEDIKETGAPDFRCHVCSRTHYTLSQLNRHIKIHTKPLRCEVEGCEMRTASKNDLDRHKVTHHQAQARLYYFCPVEGCLWHVNGPKGGFGRLDNGKRHLKSHANYHDLSLLHENLQAIRIKERVTHASILVPQPESSGSLLLLEDSDDSDSCFSITSLVSFNPSTMASSATSTSDMEPLARDSVTEISYLISNDDELQKLLEEAFCFIDRERVTRNFRRILRSFSQDLMKEAATPVQEQAAKFVGQKSRQIAVLVRENVLPSKPLILPDHNADSVRKQRLQDYVQERSPQLDSVPDMSFASVRGPVMDDDSDAENGDDDTTEHPDLTKLKEWFLSANAMQNLKENLRLFLSPAKVATTDQTGEYASSSRISSPNSDVVSDVEVELARNAAGAETAGTVHSSRMPVMLSLIETALEVWNCISARKALEPGFVRLNWTCNCGHTSHDDFRELRPGAVATYAKKLLESGYVTHAQSTNSGSGATATLITAAGNKATAIGRGVKDLTVGKQGRSPKSKTRKFADIQCSPTPGMTCRWLHLCLKQRPNSKVTKLEALHICKDKEQKDLTDSSFFEVLRIAWKTQRTWTDLILFRLARIEFIKFFAFPDDSVDRIVADMVPPSTDQYDFAPPPPLEMVPPIAADHMVHLLLSECTSSMQGSSFYLSQLPKKKDKPLKFSALNPHSLEVNTGYGLRFVETPDSSIIVTFLFLMAVLIGTAFGVCWTVFKKDMQNAWPIAAYFVSVMALAVVTWQIRATS